MMSILRGFRTVVFSILVVVLSAGLVHAADPVGLWLTEGGKSRVEITQCGDKLCGTIVWLKEPNDEDDKEKLDKNNPDPALKIRKILGLPLLAGFVKSAEAGVWESGRIYNPEDGETYKCTMTLQDPDTLKVRGYVGIPLFGKTQVWTRAK